SVSTIRRAPTSPLFPYTTLFRSRTRAWGVLEALEARTMLSASSQHAVAPLLKTVSHSLSVPTTSKAKLVATPVVSQPSSGKPVRSEEHTSELQSRGHLVCRLLLE